MKFVTSIMAVFLLAGCTCSENVVTVKQTRSDSPVILRLKKDKATIFSISYPLTLEAKKNVRREVNYAENSYLFRNVSLSSGTAGCYLTAQDYNINLDGNYKRLDGSILYLTYKNDSIQEMLSEEIDRMVSEKKDTVHIQLKEFRKKHGKLIENYLMGDSMILHFNDHKKWYDIPLKVDLLVE